LPPPWLLPLLVPLWVIIMAGSHLAPPSPSPCCLQLVRPGPSCCLPCSSLCLVALVSPVVSLAPSVFFLAPPLAAS
ncbi:hypothetical protein M9458_039960, partial [Cirrhinus mrigala]